MMPRAKSPVFFVLGSTGSGKSKVAVQLAQELRDTFHYKSVIIVNCDVYQCYDALPISTNKPSADELGGIPHAFLGFLDRCGSLRQADEIHQSDIAAAHGEASAALAGGAPFNVHSYETMVTRFIVRYFAEHADGAVIVCGGTCYYAQALLFSDSLVCEGGTDAALLSKHNNDENTSCGLWEELNRVDSEVAKRYHPNDHRRIKRMLEIYETTGKRPSDVFEARETKLRFDSESLFLLWTRMERPTLDTSLNRRVDEMMQRGMLDEIKTFWRSFEGQLPENSLSKAIGCKEFSQFFSDATPDLISGDDVKAAVEQVKGNTRQYARQQERWIQNRLLPMLQASPLKQQWNHFRVFRTDKESCSSSSMNALLNTLFGSLPEGPVDPALLPLYQNAAPPEPVCQQRCDVCEALVYGRGQMEAHVTSKRHRGAVKRLALEKEQREKYGRELPPPKRKRSG